MAHDATTFKFLDGHTRLGKIEIKDNVFIGTDAIILPGVTIGPNVLVSAGSVVNKDIPPNSCVAGIPARFYKKFDEFLSEMKTQINTRPVFDHLEFKIKKNGHPITANYWKLYLTKERNDKIWKAVNNGNAFKKGFTGKYPYTINPV